MKFWVFDLYFSRKLVEFLDMLRLDLNFAKVRSLVFLGMEMRLLKFVRIQKVFDAR